MSDFTIEMDRDQPQGIGLAFDGLGNNRHVFFNRNEPLPEGTVRLVVSIEDYGAFLRMRAARRF